MCCKNCRPQILNNPISNKKYGKKTEELKSEVSDAGKKLGLIKKLTASHSMFKHILTAGIIVIVISGLIVLPSSCCFAKTPANYAEDSYHEEAAIEEENPDYSSKDCIVNIEDFETYNKTEYVNLTGFPTFSAWYPKGWEIIDPDLDDWEYPWGYNVYFRCYESVEINTVSMGMYPMGLLTLGLSIFNQEYSSKNPAEIVEELAEGDVEEFWSEVEVEQNTNNTNFTASFLDIDGENRFTERSFFYNLEGFLIRQSLFGIDYCVEPWAELLDIDTTRYLSIGDAEVVEEEKPKTQATQPTITLSVIEGPTKSGNMCYYRIKANISGSPYPNISFNRDDSGGNRGSDISQINIYSEDESVTLTATATNSAGSDTTSITVTGCNGMIETPKDTKPPDDENGEEEEEEDGDWIVRTIAGWSVPLIFGGYETIERGGTATMLKGSNGVFICHIHLILDDEENENWWNNCEVSIKIKATDGIIGDENCRQFFFTAPDYPCDVKITATQTTKCNGDIIGTDTDTITVHVLEVFMGP